MSDKQDRSLPHEEEGAQIELSAEQLLSLTESRSSTAPAVSAAPAVSTAPAMPAAPAVPATSAASSHDAESALAAPRALDRWKSAAAMTGIGSVLVLAATIGYQSLHPTPYTPPPPPPPVAEIDPPPPPVTAPASNEPPVLVRNPFDRREVFEFPPGTAPEEAKAAVADALLERARERQAAYDARRPKRRRSG